MESNKNISVGVIGAGSFGTAIANILAENNDVLIYARREEVADAINNIKKHNEQIIHPRIHATLDVEELATRCLLIFPIVPSAEFRKMIRNFSPYLHPDHIMIHGTKGLDVKLPEGEVFQENMPLNRKQVKTMSEVIMEESVVLRVGCLAGPNLVGELAIGQPAATVVGSRFEEVIKEGQRAMKCSRFKVFGTHDITGVELAGVLKNIMAIASGILSGLGFGDNAKALLITRGLAEMMHLGKVLGAEKKAFFGLSGVGDLIATCSSKLSRNFTVGNRLAKGEKLQDILANINEVAEGVNTLKITKALVDYYKIRAPITQTLYKIVYQDMTVEEGMKYLMDFPFNVDVDFL